MNLKDSYDNGRWKKVSPTENPSPYQFEFTFDTESFEEWWAEIKAFAEQNRIPTQYVEDEFLIDGELIPIHLTFQDDNDYDPSEDDTGCDF